MSNTNSKNSLRVRITQETNGTQVFKAIIYHPMESGYRRDYQTRLPIPEDFIEDVVINVDGQDYATVYLGKNVSSNPFLMFALTRNIVNGQKIQVSWHDHHQRETRYEFNAQFGQDLVFNFNGEKENAEPYKLAPEGSPVCKTRPKAN